MSPVHSARLFALALLPAFATPPLSARAAGSAEAADPSVAVALDEIGYKYEIDADGDYSLVMGLPDSERTQLVYVRSPVESYGSYRIREVWSPAYKSATDAFPGPVANRLLEASNEIKLGSWVKQGQHAVFVIKIDADAQSQVLEQAISAAVSSADEMEQELAGADSDEF